MVPADDPVRGFSTARHAAPAGCRWPGLASGPTTRHEHDRTLRDGTTGPGKRWTDMAGGDREKALDVALAQIEKQFGKGSVMRLGDETRAPLEVIPTGSIALDVALGLGGLPRGRVVEIYGPESSGKTTVALHAVANAQRAGGIVAFIDAEHALDPDYAKALGVDTDALLVTQPDSGEQALEIADMLVRSGALDLVVIDSVAALVPARRDRGRDGRQPRRSPGPPDEPGPAEDDRRAQQLQHHRDLHQPAAREDRGDVRLARDHHRRPGAEVLLLGPPRRASHRDAQGRHRHGRQPHPGQGRRRTRWPRRSSRRSSTSCTARASAARAA